MQNQRGTGEIMFDRCTDRVREVMNLAKIQAKELNHEYIGTEHILIGLAREGSGIAANVIKNMDISLKSLIAETIRVVQAGPDVVTTGDFPYTPGAKQCFEHAVQHARLLNHNYIGTEHILLGLLEVKEGCAARILKNLNVNMIAVREEVMNLVGIPEDTAVDRVKRALKDLEVNELTVACLNIIDGLALKGLAEVCAYSAIKLRAKVEDYLNG